MLQYGDYWVPVVEHLSLVSFLPGLLVSVDSNKLTFEDLPYHSPRHTDEGSCDITGARLTSAYLLASANVLYCPLAHCRHCLLVKFISCSLFISACLFLSSLFAGVVQASLV